VRVGSGTHLYVPISYERHPHCFLSEAVLDAGVPLDHTFKFNDRDHSVADLVTSARGLFKFDSSESDLNIADKLAWSLTAFARVTDPLNDTWVNAYGEQIQFSTIVESAMGVLERGTRRLQDAMDKAIQEPVSDHVHDFACAGTHLIYGLTTCLSFGYRAHGLPERMKSQFDILIWRLENDMRLVDGYYDEASADYPAPLARMYRLDTKLKILGHAFEIINNLKKNKLFEPTVAQQAVVDRARQTLNEVASEIDYHGVENFSADELLFNLLIGDMCHAYHGLGGTPRKLATKALALSLCFVPSCCITSPLSTQ